MKRIAMLIALSLLLSGAAVGLAILYIVPVLVLEPPTGPHRVGSANLYLSDGSRRYVAQLWYPAEASPGDRRMPYRDSAVLAKRFAHHRFIKTHSYREARPLRSSASAWPIVLFSPGSGGYRSQCTYLMEELASHGYVVVGLDHPLSSGLVAFPDGEIVRGLSTDWLNLDSRAQWESSARVVEATAKRRADDMVHAYETLQSAPPNPLAAEVARSIDFTKAAAIGHSFGGAAAAELCRRDARFLTGADFDGWLFGETLKSGTGKEFLFAIEDDPLLARNEGPFPDNVQGNARLGTKEYHESVRRSLDRWGGYFLRPFGAVHGMYSDLHLYVRWPYPGVARDHEKVTRRVQKLTREAVLALLDRQLKGRDETFLRESRTTGDYELKVDRSKKPKETL